MFECHLWIVTSARKDGHLVLDVLFSSSFKMYERSVRMVPHVVPVHGVLCDAYLWAEHFMSRRIVRLKSCLTFSLKIK